MHRGMEDEDKLKNYYAIIRIDYNKNISRKQQRIDEVNKLTEKAIMIYGEKYKFNYSNVLVLWNDLPREKYLCECIGYSEEDLIKQFCKMLRNKKVFRLYIESPLTLINAEKQDFSEILRRLHMIWKESNGVPVFIEDNFLCNDYTESEIKEKLTAIDKQKRIEITKENILISEKIKLYNENDERDVINNIQKENADYFNRFFSSVDILLQMVGVPKIMKNRNDFINLYFKWQNDEMNVEECLHELGDIARASWYRYVNNFEKSPIYEEYMNAYPINLNRIRKKGILPDTLDFLVQFKHDNKRYLKFENLGLSKANRWNCYLEFDEVYSMKDVLRIAYACEYKVNIMKHKCILEAKLNERNITEKDIAIRLESLV